MVAASAATSGESMRRGRRDGHGVGLDDPTRPAGKQHHPIARRTASRTLWVTKTTVRPGSRQIRSSSSWSRSRVMASRAPKGSSISRILAVLGQGPGQGHPLAHAAGQLVGPLGGEPVQAHQLAAARRPGPGAPPWRTLRSRRGSSTLRATVSQGNRAASWNIKVASPTVRSTGTGRGPVQAGDQVEQGALAAPRRAHQAHELPGRDVKRDPIQGGDGRPDPTVDLGHPLEHAGPARYQRPCSMRARTGRRSQPGDLRLALGRQHLVERGQVVDAGRLVGGFNRPTASAWLTWVCSVEASGSTVKTRFAHASVSTFDAQRLAALQGSQLGVERGLGGGGLSLDVAEGVNQALQEPLHGGGVLSGGRRCGQPRWSWPTCHPATGVPSLTSRCPPAWSIWVSYGSGIQAPSMAPDLNSVTIVPLPVDEGCT